MTIKRSQARRGLETLTRLVSSTANDTRDARALLAYIKSVIEEKPEPRNTDKTT